jgi:hypothetical protein
MGIAMEVEGPEYEDLYGDVWGHLNPEEQWNFDSD